VRLCTIGFAGKGLEQFVGLLRGAGVELLVDVRLRPSSQLSGYARGDDLRYVLETYERIDYVHAPELAPTDEALNAYRRTRDWDAYAAAFLELAERRAMERGLGELVAGREVVALLCAEAQAVRCHRRLLAEAYAREHAGTEVVHLGAGEGARQAAGGRRVAALRSGAAVVEVPPGIGLGRAAEL
jgi:uncharacterized protein (DUF488 family)